MAKVNDKVVQYVKYAVMVLVLLTFLQTCGTKGKIKDLEKEIEKHQEATKAEMDSLYDVIISKDEMIELIKETPAWKTLRIEEISDKERISINALEEKEN